MLEKMSHIAIAVPDLEAASCFYRDRLRARVSRPRNLPEHGVTVVFVELSNVKIELLHPLGENSPIAKFLARNPAGGIHHICCEVADMEQSMCVLRAEGVRISGSGEPMIGAHGKPVIFLDPKGSFGALIELEQS